MPSSSPKPLAMPPRDELRLKVERAIWGLLRLHRAGCPTPTKPAYWPYWMRPATTYPLQHLLLGEPH